MSNKREYTFTGFMPSGNPFKWYYDENKRTAFTTSIDVESWDKAPVKGDKITFVDEDVYINGKLVFKNSPKKQKEISKRNDDSITAQIQNSLTMLNNI